MRGSRLIVLFIVAAIALVVAWSASAEEATGKEPIAKDRLVEVLGRVKEGAGAAAASHAASIEHGDALLEAALSQLSVAESLFAK